MQGKVAIVGAGAIGRPWAIVFARAGYRTTLHVRRAEAVAEVRGAIETELAALADDDLLWGATPETVAGRIETTTDLAEAIADALFVAEAVPEALETKRSIHRELDALVPPDVTIGSATSGTPASLFTEPLRHRRRCLVAHPVNPPHLVPVVEMVPTPWTDPAHVERARALLSAVGHAPIVVKREIEGFVLNQLQGALVNAAFKLVADGYADPDDVDTAVAKGLGLRWSFMGPLETVDLNCPGGIRAFAETFGDMFYAVQQHLAAAERWTPALIGKVEAARRARLPLDELPARQAWRDAQLRALAAGKSETSEET